MEKTVDVRFAALISKPLQSALTAINTPTLRPMDILNQGSPMLCTPAPGRPLRPRVAPSPVLKIAQLGELHLKCNFYPTLLVIVDYYHGNPDSSRDQYH